MYESTITHFAEVARDKATGLQRAPAGFFVGAMLGGAYIGVGMIVALACAAGLAPGARPLVMGATFGIGLILTVFAGAELFTGYVMYTGFGLARGTIRWGQALQLLTVAWIGNLAGAALLSTLFIAGGAGPVLADGGAFLSGYAMHKVDAGVLALLARAVLCNWLVCVAIWTAARVSSDTKKFIALGWVLLAFVAAGFEPSVANMTALTLALLEPHGTMTLHGVLSNLVLVTAGNIAGSAVFVVCGYLTTATADPPGEALHDTAPLPTTLRTPPRNGL